MKEGPSHRKYRLSPKGIANSKLCHYRYNHGSKGKMTKSIYRNSPRGKSQTFMAWYRFYQRFYYRYRDQVKT